MDSKVEYSKKEYVTPAMTVVTFSGQSPLLSGSGEDYEEEFAMSTFNDNKG